MMRNRSHSDGAGSVVTGFRGLRQAAAGGFLFCLSCSSLWDPLLIYRCPSGEACGQDMAVPRAVEFGAVTKFAAGAGPGWVTVGDFNGDMKLDLVVANELSNNVSVLLGNGLGGFSAATHFSTSSRPFVVAIGDAQSNYQLTPNAHIE